jgi:hypothetical protein
MARLFAMMDGLVTPAWLIIIVQYSMANNYDFMLKFIIIGDSSIRYSI